MTSYDWIEDDRGRFDTPVAPLSAEARRLLERLDVACGTVEGWYAHKGANEMPCGDCTWAHERRGGREWVVRAGCGTAAGWLVHRNHCEEACPDCTEAKAKDDASKCGSLAGWQRHRQKKEVPCDRCSHHQSEYNRLRRWRALHGDVPPPVPPVRVACPVCHRFTGPVTAGSTRLARHKTAPPGSVWCSGSYGVAAASGPGGGADPGPGGASGLR